ncbi:MAG: cupin domain-containing protein [Solirubrobacteraceae bacterium]
MEPPSALPFTLSIADVELDADSLDPATVLEGEPRAYSRALRTSSDGRWEIGVWELTPGVVTDVEAEEVFLVVSGSATVEITGWPALELGPGVIGAFAGGERTVWRVRDTLRKLYMVAVND